MKTPIFGDLSDPYSVFVTITDDIYVDNNAKSRVDKSRLNTEQSIIVLNTNRPGYGLFVDINNYLYCSVSADHQVIKKLLDNVANPSTVVASVGSSGASPDMLMNPKGIFVDINFDLYVADSGNNRIQLFKAGVSTATT